MAVLSHTCVSLTTTGAVRWLGVVSDGPALSKLLIYVQATYLESGSQHTEYTRSVMPDLQLGMLFVTF